MVLHVYYYNSTYTHILMFLYYNFSILFTKRKDMPNKTVSVDAVQLDGYKIETRSREHIIMVNQPVASGGTDSGPTPLEFLFISLAAAL